jgi:hypothetical protein
MSPLSVTESAASSESHGWGRPTRPQRSRLFQDPLTFSRPYLMAGATLAAIPMHPGPPSRQFIHDGACRADFPTEAREYWARIAHGSGMT